MNGETDGELFNVSELFLVAILGGERPEVADFLYGLEPGGPNFFQVGESWYDVRKSGS